MWKMLLQEHVFLGIEEDQSFCEHEQKDSRMEKCSREPQRRINARIYVMWLKRGEDQIFTDHLAIRAIFLQSLVVTPTIEECRSLITRIVTKKFIVILHKI
ncbi:hypothetical protein NPIL_11221 [Nephila pilipes]|uniref:Uncharacterized protein n=1 Tax=Nephila pilipes TaxID=299642 RepID=A0A8X6NQQ8_NEPPI|nr:hypothetical protein NPIL_11221 [Nephila pilipes]